MLFILIFIRLFLPTIVQFGLVSNTSRAVSIFVFLCYIPAVFALWYLWRQMKNADGTRGAAPT